MCGDVCTRAHEQHGEVLVPGFRRDMKGIEEAILLLARVEVAPLCLGLAEKDRECWVNVSGDAGHALLLEYLHF